jgi:hypothetical protein
MRIPHTARKRGGNRVRELIKNIMEEMEKAEENGRRIRTIRSRESR